MSAQAVVDRAQAASGGIRVGLNGHGHERDVGKAIPWGELLEMELPPERPIIADLIDEDTGNIIGGAPNVGILADAGEGAGCGLRDRFLGRVRYHTARGPDR